MYKKIGPIGKIKNKIWVHISALPEILRVTHEVYLNFQILFKKINDYIF